jgi:hypothetical protein
MSKILLMFVAQIVESCDREKEKKKKEKKDMHH